MKKIFIPIFVLFLCSGIIWKWTSGLTAFTVFSHTLAEAGPIPRNFPEINFVNQNGKTFNIGEIDKYILLNFVYLDCPFVCHKVNNELEKIYRTIDTNIIPSKLEFITISFDLKNDNIEKIAKYRNYFGDDIDGWTFALPYQINEEKLNKFLTKLGTWAYKVPETGLINHSIYLYLISPNHKIIKTFDPARENNSSIINKIKECIK